MTLTNRWVVVQNRIQLVSAIISFFLNSILIYLIRNKSPKQMGSYKYLMYFFCIFEISYSILDIVVEPTHFSHGTTFVVIVTNTDSIFPPEVLLFLDGCYSGFFGSSLAIFSIHYIYRYLVSIGSDLLKTFSSWKILFWFLIPFIYGFHWTYVAWIMCPPRNATTEYIKDDVYATFGMRPEEFVYVGPYVYTTHPDGTVTLNVADFLGALSLTAGIASSIFMILYFGINCYRNLCKIATDVESKRLRDLQSQLFQALVLQTTVPIILMHVPSAIVFTATFLNISLGSLTGVMCVTVALFPAIDPLPTMFIVKEYRVTVMRSVTYPKRWFAYQVSPVFTSSLANSTYHPSHVITSFRTDN